jgi:predicted nucleic acid-binding protein
VSAKYLVDKSAYARMHLPPVAEVLAPIIQEGYAATCGMINLEVLYSARSTQDFRAVRQELAGALVQISMHQADFDRAIEVMEALAARGEHRGVALPYLLIATVAERTGLTVLHYDQDFKRIAAVTGQPVQWVVRRGSV